MGTSDNSITGVIAPLVLALIVTFFAWDLLACLAHQARGQNQAELTKGPTIEDYEKAKVWATELLGLAATFTGFFGIKAAQREKLDRTVRAQAAEGGMISILAGATLVGAGGWPVPIALAAMVSGATAVRLVYALRNNPKGGSTGGSPQD